MDEYLRQILLSAVPINESVRSSDFIGASKQLQSKIIDLFRFTSIQLAPSFLTMFLSYIDTDAQSQDKKKRYASAVALTALIGLYPFDHHVPQFVPTMVKLLKPGYKPLVQIGAIVAGRIAKIVGKNRNVFLSELVNKCQAELGNFESPDERYCAAVIWHELAQTAPELFYQISSSTFAATISTSLFHHDQQINELITHTIELLFNSESAVLGKTFLTEVHNILIFTTIKNFSEIQKPDEVIGTLQLLLVLLRLKPSISNKIASNLLLPQCLKNVTSQNIEISFLSIETIFQMLKTGVISFDQATYNLIYQTLTQLVLLYPQEALIMFQELICTFRKFDLKSCQQHVQVLTQILEKLPSNIGPPTAFELTISIISYFPSNNSNISLFLTYVKNILLRSATPLPIHRLLAAVNNTLPRWYSTFNVFKTQILQIIRQELNHPSSLTDRLVIVLLALSEFPQLDVQETLELSGFVEKLMHSKDVEVRKLVVSTMVHIFQASSEKLPLKLIIRMVKFSLDEPSRAVRFSSIQAFNRDTYNYISQQEVFPTFCRFVNDENPEIRQHALEIIGKLPVVNNTIVRNILLSSLKQMNPNLSVIIPSTLPVWIVFPHIITASAPFLHIYAMGLFQKLSEMLTKRFTPYKDQALIFANSTILREVDNCLITSISSLYLICPNIVPLEPIISILKSMLEQPVHPWTKITGMNAIGNLVESGVRCETDLVTTLLNIIEKNDNLKLTIKTLKIIGTLGVSKISPIRKKYQSIFRSSFTNQQVFKQYFINEIFRYTMQTFHTVNILTVQESMIRCICAILHLEPSIIPEHLSSILDDLLPFIHDMNNEKLPVFLEFLQSIILDAGYLILNNCNDIFEAIKDKWIGDYTKESCKTLSSLVVATTGQCDTILNQIILNAFLLIKSRKDVEAFDLDMFGLFQTILQYSSAYRPTIITGIVDILLSPGTQNSIQERCLDTLEYAVFEIHSTTLLSSIRRCLEYVATRQQLRWRDRATQILYSMKNGGLQSSYTESFIAQPRLKPKDPKKMNLNNFMASLKTLVHKGAPKATSKTIQTWFNDFHSFLIQYSPFAVIQTMGYLEIKPKFAFQFSFLGAWLSFDPSHHQHISNKLNMILSLRDIPDSIILELARLAEFGMTCKIDLGFNTELLVQQCIKIRHYELVFAFIESIPLLKNQPIPQSLLETLTIASHIIGRKYAARSLYKQLTSCNYSTSMLLQDWPKALDLLEKTKEPERYIEQRIECLAAMEQWNEIIQLEDRFDQQSLASQVHIAQYFWIAEMYCGEQSKALEFVEKTGGYETEDCIKKAILFISSKDYKKAKKAINTGWRYLAASMSTVNKHHKFVVSRYLFHAEELQQLNEVMHIIKDPKYIDKYQLKWFAKLPQMHDDYDKQRQLFQIVSLAPEAIDLDDFAIHILSCTVAAKKNNEAQRLTGLLFPSKESQGNRFCQIFLLTGRERLEKAIQQLDQFDDAFKHRLENLIGKDLFKEASNIEDLRSAEKYLLSAELNYNKITDILILLTNITSNENDALEAIGAIKKRISSKSKSRLLYLHHLVSLFVKFSNSQKICQSIADMILSVDQGAISDILLIVVNLLTHKSEYVVQNVVRIMTYLIPSMNEVFFLNFYRELQLHKDNEIMEDLVNEIQRAHTIIYSQITLISQRLIEMAHNLWGLFILHLDEFISTSSIDEIQKMSVLLSNPNLSHFEQDFKKFFGSRISQFLDDVNSQGINEESLSSAEKLRSHIRKRQDAIRVIPLNSLNEQLDRKTTWQVIIPGARSIQNDVHLVNFNHTIQNLDNGFLVSLVGSDGKNYSFFLRRCQTSKIPQDEEFNMLIRAISPSISQLQPRNNFLLTKDVSFRERLKGSVPLLNYIASYRQSVNIRDTIEEYNEATIRDLIENNYNHDEIAKALLVTSKNAMNWSERQYTFSRSLGILSAFSYVIGGANTSLSGILIDKMTGFLDYASASLSIENSSVPFRLTNKIRYVLGSAGIKGVFRTYLMQTMEEIHKHKCSLAPCIQFHVGEAPFNEPMIPTKYLNVFVNDFVGSQEIDIVYNRINGTGSTEEEVDNLICQATSTDNLIKMPPSWIAWW